jgi:hypothetical protein
MVVGFLRRRDEIERSLLHLGGIIKLTCFGVGRGEFVEIPGVLPAGQIAGFRGVVDCFFLILDLSPAGGEGGAARVG